jgi:hypothetical protein
MWPTKKIQQIAADAADHIDASVGTLTGVLAVMALGILLALAGVAVLLARGA